MPHSMSPALPLLFALLLAQAAAAETITVGPVGSGAQFTEVQDAVDAAEPHDTILILDGSYSGPIWISEPLQIVGVGEPYLYSNSPDSSAIRIDAAGGFQAGDAVLLAGLRISGYVDSYTGSTGGVETGAPTILADCEVRRMSVGSTAVVMDGCSVTELYASGSQLWINACELKGWHTVSGGPYLVDHAGTPAASLKDCLASMSRTSIVGGRGVAGIEAGIKATGGDGLHVDGGTLVLRGGPGMLVQGGDGAHKTMCGAPCDPPIDLAGGFALSTANGAVVVIQQDIPLAGGMDGLAGQHAALSDPSAPTMTAEIYPTLALAQALLDPGGATTLFLAAEPGPALLGLSAVALAPAYMPGIDGALLVQPGGSQTLRLIIPASGMLEIPFALPPALAGIQFVAQLGTWRGNPTLSDPALLVVR